MREQRPFAERVGQAVRPGEVGIADRNRPGGAGDVLAIVAERLQQAALVDARWAAGRLSPYPARLDIDPPGRARRWPWSRRRIHWRARAQRFVHGSAADSGAGRGCSWRSPEAHFLRAGLACIKAAPANKAPSTAKCDLCHTSEALFFNQRHFFSKKQRSGLCDAVFGAFEAAARTAMSGLSTRRAEP